MAILVGNSSSSSSGSSSGGGDASAANQATGNSLLQDTKGLLTTLVESFGTPDVGVSASVVATSPFMSLFKAVGWGVISIRDRLPPQIGSQVASQSLSVTAASDSTLATSTLQNSQLTELKSLVLNSKTPQYTSVVTLSGTTSIISGASPINFASIACSMVEVANTSDADLEYSRVPGGEYFPILARSTRKIVGITNASSLSFRRSDQATVATVIKVEVYTI